MIYLITQIFIFMLIAAVLGFLLGCWLCKRKASSHTGYTASQYDNDANTGSSYQSQSAASTAVASSPASDDTTYGAAETTTAEPATKPSLDDTRRPSALTESSTRDNLEEIRGIGPKLHGVLNDLGIFTFQQIADFDRGNIEWVDQYLTFKGRIDREEWVAQAQKLARR